MCLGYTIEEIIKGDEIKAKKGIMTLKTQVLSIYNRFLLVDPNSL